MTNFLLVRATVTTSTMEALPIITPSEVSAARSLLARNASMATDTVSRRCMLSAFLAASKLPARAYSGDRAVNLLRIFHELLRGDFDFQTGGQASHALWPDRGSRCEPARSSDIHARGSRTPRVLPVSRSRPRRGRILRVHRGGQSFFPCRPQPLSAPPYFGAARSLRCQKSAPAI